MFTAKVVGSCEARIGWCRSAMSRPRLARRASHICAARESLDWPRRVFSVVELSQTTLQLRGGSFNIIGPSDFEVVMDAYRVHGYHAPDAFWAQLCPASVMLAQMILDNPEFVAGKRVCELGCGLGLPGVASALAGASEVVLVGGDPLALQCALLTAVANGVPEAESVARHPLAWLGPEGAAAELKHVLGLQEQLAASVHAPPAWSSLATTLVSQEVGVVGNPSKERPAESRKKSRMIIGATSTLTPAGQLTACQKSPQQLLTDGEQFDVVLASDLLFNASTLELLAQVVCQVLTPTKGTLLLADPARRFPEHRQEFSNYLGQHHPPFVPVFFEEGRMDMTTDAMREAGEVGPSVPVVFQAYKCMG